VPAVLRVDGGRVAAETPAINACDSGVAVVEFGFDFRDTYDEGGELGFLAMREPFWWHKRRDESGS